MAVLTGTSGNDSFNGTVGVEDLALIDSLQSRTTFRRLPNMETWQVQSATAGLDTLSSIDRVRLADAEFQLRLGSTQRIQNAQFDGGLATFANGDFMVAYLKPGATTGAFAQRYNAIGEKVGGEISIATTVSLLIPRLVAFSDGSFMAAFSNTDGSGNGVFLQRFDAAGTKIGAAAQVNTFTTGNQSLESIVRLADNSIVLSWNSSGQDGDGNGVYAQRFSAGGTRQGPEFRVAQETAGGQMSSILLAAPDGGFFARYVTASNTAVQKFSAAGAKVGPEILLGSNGAQALVALPNGNLATFDTGTGIRRFILDPAGTVLKQETLFMPTSTVQLVNLTATSLTGGRHAVSWQGRDGFIYAQVFDATGRPLSPVRSFQASFDGVGESFLQGTADGGFALRTGSNGLGVVHRFDSEGLPIHSTIQGDETPNVIVAEGDRVSLYGRGGNDVLRGSGLDDLLSGGEGADTLIGGTGNDWYLADRTDTIVENMDAGIDTVEVTGSYTLTARNVENLVMAGTASGDLTGNALDNNISGNSGDNVLNGGAGSDRMLGGLGDDTYVVDQILIGIQAGDQVIEEADAGLDTVISQIEVYALTANVENLLLAGSAVRGIGNGLNNRIVGNGGNNILNGAGGSDTLIGEAGNDSYEVDTDDIVIENPNGGRDLVTASLSWTLGDNLEDLTLAAAAGAASATGNALANTILGNDFANTLDGAGGIDIMNGGLGADSYFSTLR